MPNIKGFKRKFIPSLPGDRHLRGLVLGALFRCTRCCNKKWIEEDVKKDGERYSECLNCRNWHAEENNWLFKEAVYKHYGSKCACCPETEIRFMTLDHPKDDGWKQRDEARFQDLRGIPFYRELVKSGFRCGYDLQLMCWLCNGSKMMNGGVCAHAGYRGDKQINPGRRDRVVPIKDDATKGSVATRSWREERKALKQCTACTADVSGDPQGRLRCQDCRQKDADREQEYRLAALEAYGDACSCCGLSGHPSFLTISYADPDVRTAERGDKRSIAKKAFDAGFPSGKFVIYCWNCQGSLNQYGFCPHDESRPEKPEWVANRPAKSEDAGESWDMTIFAGKNISEDDRLAIANHYVKKMAQINKKLAKEDAKSTRKENDEK